jgi:hypothetical protein
MFKKLFEKQTWNNIGEYLMYYIDYFLSTWWNMIKVWFFLTLFLILLPIPPILWKVHAFMFTLTQDKPLSVALWESKIASPPMEKE